MTPTENLNWDRPKNRPPTAINFPWWARSTKCTQRTRSYQAPGFTRVQFTSPYLHLTTMRHDITGELYAIPNAIISELDTSDWSHVK